jgi:hypothetical protein
MQQSEDHTLTLKVRSADLYKSKMFNRKRVSNDELLKDPVLSGDLVPDVDNMWTLGSATKILKTGFFNTLNVISTVTSFVTISLAGVSNQIVMGTGTTTTLNAPTPGQNQTVTVPDSGTASTQVILQDSSSQQNINSNLQVANNMKFTPTSTFVQTGLMQIQPDANSKSILQILGWGNFTIFVTT